MAELRLETRDGQTHFYPEQLLHGVAGWELPSAPRSVEVRLVWCTQGRGRRDERLVLHEQFADAPAVDARIFAFRLPGEPYSFSGQAISLRWGLELLIDGEVRKRLDLVIAPEARVINLTELDPMAHALAG